jgi:hypothetical protein
MLGVSDEFVNVATRRALVIIPDKIANLLELRRVIGVLAAGDCQF